MSPRGWCNNTFEGIRRGGPEIGPGHSLSMSKFFNGIGTVTVLFILLALLAVPGSGIETKTAYTQDGIHYVSKERVDENIRYEYAKPGDYREVSVPLDTIVVDASAISENISLPQGKKETETNSTAESNQTASAYAPENKYPYASLFIGMLAIGGLIIFVASIFSGRD